jgi:hypothetical protein
VGAFPLNGGTFTVTTVTNPPLATLAITSSSIGTSQTAGTQGNIVGAWNFTGGNNTLNLEGITFHVIGSANMTNLQNVKLLINGSQVGPTLASVPQSGLAYFNLANASAKLNTGNNNVQVQADITGSPSYTFQWEVLNGYDVNAVDSQYGVPVSVSLTSGADSQVTIQAGQTTTSQDSTTPTGNIAKGVSQVTLAKFDVYAAGEPTKVKFLDFDLVFTGLNVASDTSLSTVVKNVDITDDAGNQVGTTINTPPSGNSCASTDAAAAGSPNYTGGGTWPASTSTLQTLAYYDCFGSSASPINYVIPANTTRVLSLKADIQTTANFSTVTANLLTELGNSNLQGQISSQSANSSGANGSALSLSNSSLTVTQNSGLGTQTISKGSTNQEIGSYALSASSAEGVNVSTVSINLPNTGFLASNLQNLKLFVNGTQFGTTVPTVNAGTYTFSGTQFNVPAGQTVNVNVFADINSSAFGASTGGVTALNGVSGSGAISNSAVTLSSSIAGQNLTVAGGSTIAVTAAQGQNPAATQVAMGNTGQVLGVYNFQETANVESVKVTQLFVDDVVATTTIGTPTTTAVLPSFSKLYMYGPNSMLLGTASNYATGTVGGQQAFIWNFQFGNSTPFVIPRNGTLPVVLKGDVNAYTAGNVTDASTHTFEIATSSLENTSTLTVVALGATSNQPTAVTLSGAAGGTQTILRNTLGFAYSQLGNASNRAKSVADQLATLTFTPGATGQVALNTLTITLAGTALSTTSATLQSMASSTYLSLNGTAYNPSATTVTTSTQTATVTFNFGAGIAGFSVSGPTSFTLITNSGQYAVVAGGTNSVSLYATLASTAAIQYTDGTDATANVVSSLGLPSSTITPIQIFGAQYSQGS